MSTSIKSGDLASTSQALTQALEQNHVAAAVAAVVAPAVVLLSALAQATTPATAQDTQALDTGTQTQAGDASAMDSLLSTGAVATALGTAVGTWMSDLGDSGSADTTDNYTDVNGADLEPDITQGAEQQVPVPTTPADDSGLAAVSPLAAQMSRQGLENGTRGTTFTDAVSEGTNALMAHTGYKDYTSRSITDLSGSSLGREMRARRRYERLGRLNRHPSLQERAEGRTAHAARAIQRSCAQSHFATQPSEHAWGAPPQSLRRLNLHAMQHFFDGREQPRVGVCA